jgi:hypothetical protein
MYKSLILKLYIKYSVPVCMNINTFAISNIWSRFWKIYIFVRFATCATAWGFINIIQHMSVRAILQSRCDLLKPTECLLKRFIESFRKSILWNQQTFSPYLINFKVPFSEKISVPQQQLNPPPPQAEIQMCGDWGERRWGGQGAGAQEKEEGIHFLYCIVVPQAETESRQPGLEFQG